MSTERPISSSKNAPAETGAQAGIRGLLQRLLKHLDFDRPSRILVALVILIMVGGVATAAGFILQSRARTLSLAEQEVERVNLVLADQIARTIRSIDIVLRATEESYEGMLARGPIDTRAVYDLLVARVAAVSDIVRAHGIVDADAVTRLSSRAFPASPVYTGDREYFTLHRDHPEIGLLITGPVQSRAGGEWSLYQTRRITGPDGAFAGVAFTSIEPRYFEDQFESLNLGAGSALALFVDDAILAARYPRAPEAIGQSFADRFPFKSLLAGRDRASGRIPASAFDGQPRVVSLQRLPGMPLTVAVSLDEDSVLADWRRQAWVVALWTAGALGALLFLLCALIRLLRRHERTASALESTGRSLEMAQRVAHLGSWSWDLSRRQLTCSREMYRILGRTGEPGPLGEQDIVEQLHPDERARLEPVAHAVLAGKPEQHLETRIIRPDGAVRWVEIEAEAVREPGGKLSHVFGTMLDISERKAFEEELRQSQRLDAIGKLTGGVAHDFNNLLAIISGNLELAIESLPPSSQIGAMLSAALRAALRGATLTHSLLAFARQQTLSPAAIDLDKLLDDMIDLIRRTVPENIEIETVREPGLWMCEADSGQLQNALLNLVVNARDAMPNGGRLTIQTGNADLDSAYATPHADVEPGQYVTLAVSDTGTGMPPHVAARAFEPFFTTKTGGKGTGLGLSMVYGFAKQSRGHATIQSQPERGTTVRIYLPRSMAAAEEAADRETGAMTGVDETILLVEDDPDVRTLVSNLLRSLGYKVMETAAPRDALRLLMKEPRISLLLTDVVLRSDMNGRQLADEALRSRPHLKVLLMSGYTEDAVVHHGRPEAGVQLLQKPFTKSQLGANIRRLLSAPEDA